MGNTHLDAMTVNRNLGLRYYEMSDHLGNVLATVMDRKSGHVSGTPSLYDYWYANVASAQDYYPFGMQMPGRVVGLDTRFGFNGKMKDNEIAGAGNHVDFGERGYDPRRISWWSPDKMAAKYPGISPYAFVRNSPISQYDPDGNTDYSATVKVNKNAKGEVTKTITNTIVYAIINLSSTPLYSGNAVSG